MQKTALSLSKPILVTGGGGYIGSHVTEQLLEKGFRVRVYDKFVFGKNILKDLKNNNKLELVEGDISDLYRLTKAMQGAQAVVHLAGIVGDPACSLNPELTKHMNVASARIVKDLSKSLAYKRFVFASSCSVYGASDELVNEESKLNPVSLYAKTKIDSEEEILGDTDKDFHPTILRFATVFGHSRRPRFDLVTNFFIAQAYVDGLITVKGSGQWRPFVHVADIARAITMVLEVDQDKVNRQIFNVGGDSLNSTIGDLAELVKSVVKLNNKGGAVKISVDDNIDDPRNYKVSFDKISEVLGFKPKMSLKAGIEEIHDNFRKGIYKKDYKDSRYINLEMTKLMNEEFFSEKI